MRKLGWFLFFLFVPMVALAGMGGPIGLQLIAASTVAEGGCTTPTTGNELNEGFIGTGYENTWNETVAAGHTLDEDYTLSGTPPTDSCTEGLRVTVDGAGLTYTRWDRGSTIDVSETDIDFTFDLYIESWDIAAYGYAPLVSFSSGTDPTTGYPVRIRLRNNAGALQIEATSTGTRVGISTETWYTVTLHIDADGANHYFTVVGGGNTTCDTAGDACVPGVTDTTDFRYISIGALDGFAGASAYQFGFVSLNLP
jgi:hypothetical protein